MRIFLSAAREARPYVSPALIAGVEYELTRVQEDEGEVHVDAAVGAAFLPGFPRPQESISPAESLEVVHLTGRPTGGYYRSLPWWEVTVDG